MEVSPRHGWEIQQSDRDSEEKNRNFENEKAQ
jgi:hypothetical protein